MKKLAIVLLLALSVCATAVCTSNTAEHPEPRPLMFESETGNFFFTDTNGNRVIYTRTDNTLTVEPDIDVDELALAFCRAEQQAQNPARFSAVGLVLAEAVIPFVETVERVCDR